MLKDIAIVPSNMSLAAVIDHLGSDISMQRDRPYKGQHHTTNGVRGSQVVSGVTFRDIKDCFIRGYILSHSYYKDGSMDKIEPNATLIDECRKGESAAICENDLYALKGDIDPIATWQNMSCEIEKIMGIYPNIKGMVREV